MLKRHATQALHLLPWLIETECNKQYLSLLNAYINWMECLHIAACWKDTQHKHCIYCEGGTNCICWVDYLHLVTVVVCWRDTQHKRCIYCRDSLKLSGTNMQWSFILLLIKWSVCILSHVGETHNTSTAFTVTHWKWNNQCLFLLLNGVSVLTIIATCSSIQIIEDPDWWHQMIIFKYLLHIFVALHIPTQHDQTDRFRRGLD